MDDLPILIEERFKELAPYRNDLELFEKLKSNPLKLLLFFEQISEDETWSAKHLEFCRLALVLFSNYYLAAELDKALAERLYKVIQGHYSLYAPILPKPITIRLVDREIAVNPISVSVASSYLEQRIFTECVEKKHRSLELVKLDPDLTLWTLRYMETGLSEDLFRWDSGSLNKLLEISEALQVKPLSQICEKMLALYLTDENCQEAISESVNKKRAILLGAALTHFNKKTRGFTLYPSSFGGLKAELSGSEDAVFAEIKRYSPYLQELKACDPVLEKDEFWALLPSAPQLQRLDLSGTHRFNPHLLDIPQSITDLDISGCEWVTEEKFHFICEALYWLQSLSIAYNLNLSYRCLSAFRHLKELCSLDISHCSFGKEEIALISQLLPNLQNLIK